MTKIVASVGGGESDPNIGDTKVYTDPLSIFLYILLIMNKSKGKTVPPPYRQPKRTKLQG